MTDTTRSRHSTRRNSIRTVVQFTQHSIQKRFLGIFTHFLKWLLVGESVLVSQGGSFNQVEDRIDRDFCVKIWEKENVLCVGYWLECLVDCGMWIVYGLVNNVHCSHIVVDVVAVKLMALFWRRHTTFAMGYFIGTSFGSMWKEDFFPISWSHTNFEINFRYRRLLMNKVNGGKWFDVWKRYGVNRMWPKKKKSVAAANTFQFYLIISVNVIPNIICLWAFMNKANLSNLKVVVMVWNILGN